MKKLLLATTGLLALAASAPAFAADMAARPYTKAPPAMMATVNEWTGFYIGFNAGGGSSRDRWNLLTNAGRAVNPLLSNEGTTNGDRRRTPDVRITSLAAVIAGTPPTAVPMTVAVRI